MKLEVIQELNNKHYSKKKAYFLLLYIGIKLTPFGNNVNNITLNLKGVFNLIRKVEIAGVNTAKLPVLSNKEKQELLVKIKNGDNEAREKFIQGNLRLVLSVIQRFTSRGENIDDLFQIGCVGLIKAIDNFDITQDVQFSTYRSSNDNWRNKKIFKR